MNKRDKLEVWKGQVTGSVPNQDGFYLALLKDKHDEFVWDLRYYALDKDGKGGIHPTRLGVFLDASQRKALKLAMNKAEQLMAQRS